MPGSRRSHVPTHSRRSGQGRGSQLPPGWEKIRSIGQGAQGTAALVRHTATGQLAVRKTMESYSVLRNSNKPLEVYILESILPSSRHITQLLDHTFMVKPHGDLELVQYFEYCRGGDLDHAIRSLGTQLPEDFVWHCFIQIAEALDVVHNRGSQMVVHGDIKPDNIFLDRPLRPGSTCPNLKLGDFGTAVIGEQGNGIHVPEWQGPELPALTRAGDIWSLGAIVHWMCHGGVQVIRPPPARFQGTLDEWTLRPEARKPKPLPSQYSNRLNSYMMACLQWDPRDRISTRRLMDGLKGDRPRQRHR